MDNWTRRPQACCRHRRPTPEGDNSKYRSGLGDDGVPVWEKKFCSEVGMVPWWKVVKSKTFMYSNCNVLNWDDSAAQEAFNEAKGRFWSEINNFPYDNKKPDPDLYIDEIDWNSSINPKLLKDLDQHAIAEDLMDSRTRRRNKRLQHLMAISEKSQGRTENHRRDSEWRDNLQSSFQTKRKWYYDHSISVKAKKENNAWKTSATPTFDTSQWNCTSAHIPGSNHKGNQWTQRKILTKEAESCGGGWSSVVYLKDDGFDNWRNESGSHCYGSQSKKMKINDNNSPWSGTLGITEICCKGTFVEEEVSDGWNVNIENRASCRWNKNKFDALERTSWENEAYKIVCDDWNTNIDKNTSCRWNRNKFDTTEQNPWEESNVYREVSDGWTSYWWKRNKVDTTGWNS